jgi:hypothetical protein
MNDAIHAFADQRKTAETFVHQTSARAACASGNEGISRSGLHVEPRDRLVPIGMTSRKLLDIAKFLPPTSDTGNSWIQLFTKVHDKYIPQLPFDGNVEYGMSAAFLFAQALQKAGKDVTRQGIVDTVNKGGFTGPGLVPYRFSATSHAGFGGAQLATTTNGVTTLLGTPLLTDSTNGPITPYTTAQPAAPANGIPPA